jgi:hypothetical protein
MATPSIEQVTALAAALGLGGIVTKAFGWWTHRQNAQRREPASMTRAAAELMDSLSDGGKELLDEFRTEFKYLRRRVVELQALADEGRAEAIAARKLAEDAQADHSKCQAELLELRDRIDVLMAGPVATYAGSDGK